jgi:putative ABC transport system ATP-binding protein
VLPTDQLAVRCEDVVKIYSAATGEVHALKGVDAAFAQGTVTAIVGPSGSGKSSLLRLLAGMDRPSAGRVEIAGEDLAAQTARSLRALRRRSIGVVFQRPTDNLVSYLTAREHLLHAAAVRRSRLADPDALLERMGLAARADHRPDQLSGGEQQRLAIAQAVVGDPLVIVADEPTAELDSDTGKRILHLFREVAAAGTAVILATHDAMAVEAADRTLYLRHGAVQAERTERHSALAVIDGAGRVQLPQEALALFPRRRALVRVTEEGVVLEVPPIEPPAGEPREEGS